MAEGDYVEIQCEGAAPEDEGRIQWFFNNRVRASSFLKIVSIRLYFTLCSFF